MLLALIFLRLILKIRLILLARSCFAILSLSILITMMILDPKVSASEPLQYKYFEEKQ